MMRHIVLLLTIACVAIIAVGQSTFSQPASGSVEQKGPLQKVIGDYLSLGVNGPGANAYLIGYTGMPVYTYSRDKGLQSTCYDNCTLHWRPYIVGAQDDLGPQSGVEGKVSTTARSDGNLQLTYNGRPLYFYAADKADEPPAGHNLEGVWRLGRP
jgi:predicted lipoprotein with Yx(FWY)xxD motif